MSHVIKLWVQNSALHGIRVLLIAVLAVACVSAGREFHQGPGKPFEMANWQAGETIFAKCKVIVLLSKYNWWIQSQAWFAVILETSKHGTIK